MSSRSNPSSLPLDGLKVVALEHAVAAPFASRQLADLGARVIKIERPEVGDFARGYDETVRGMSSFFVWANRGKQSLCLDLKQAEAVDALHRILGSADVFIQNLAPGATGRMGLDFAALSARYPRLIVCDISGYGNTGPARDARAYDLLIQAAAGLISVTGPEDRPSRAGISIADISAGMYAYSGILTALVQRSRTGRGEHVEISMLESLAEWMSYPLNFSHYGGAAPVRSGSSHPAIAPYGQYPVGDGSSIIFGLQNEREWSRFCDVVLGSPETATRDEFASNTQRVAHRAMLDALIVERLSTLDRAEALRLLDEARIANAPMNTMEDVWNHPQLKARQRWRSVMTPVGEIDALLPPATFSGFEAAMAAVPALGEHTEAILREHGILPVDRTAADEAR